MQNAKRKTQKAKCKRQNAKSKKHINHKGGAYFLIDGPEKLTARNYQSESIDALKQKILTEDKQNVVFNYDNKQGIIFKMIKYENKYLMIKDDDTYSVFVSDDDIPKKYMATVDLKAKYGEQTIEIKKGSFFYATDPLKPMIGWRGSYNPPKNMDGYSAIDEDIVNGDFILYPPYPKTQ